MDGIYLSSSAPQAPRVPGLMALRVGSGQRGLKVEFGRRALKEVLFPGHGALWESSNCVLPCYGLLCRPLGPFCAFPFPEYGLRAQWVRQEEHASLCRDNCRDSCRDSCRQPGSAAVGSKARLLG